MAQYSGRAGAEVKPRLAGGAGDLAALLAER